MKNKQTLIFAVSMILMFGAGCGITERIQKSLGTENANTVANTDSPAANTASNAENAELTPGGEKIGIAECDEVYDLLTEGMKPKEEESYVAKTTREFILNQIRQSFRDSIKNEKDHEKLKQKCVQYLEQLKKYKAEEQNRTENL